MRDFNFFLFILPSTTGAHKTSTLPRTLIQEEEEVRTRIK